MAEHDLKSSPLGHQSQYVDKYDNSLLFPIQREGKREEIGIGFSLPFKGYDLWTAFELSWLNPRGKPVVAVADFIIPCESKCIIESKSFKLYLNSFNNSSFESYTEVANLLTLDLSQAVGSPVRVKLYSDKNDAPYHVGSFEGFCLDDLDIACNEYVVKPEILHVTTGHVAKHKVYSHLLKSNCLVTGQPDWGSIQITYTGTTIDHESLLQYLVSYRNHNEFHEQCVERIFMDIQRQCHPEELMVYARYTRRGGLDINPIRSSEALLPPTNTRLFRQ